MLASRLLAILTCSTFIFLGCGQEEYATPEKTLERYVANKNMGTPAQIEVVLHCFKKADMEWWNNHYVEICQKKFGTFHSLCEATRVGESNIWHAVMDDVAPTTAEVESSNIDENAGTATLVVQGQEIYFVKEHGNWKIDGFFGVDDDLKEQYPELK